jgi:hypothetical protein
MSVRCVAITHNESQCLRNSLEGSEYCWQHYDMYNNNNIPVDEFKNTYTISEIELDLIDAMNISNLENLQLSESTTQSTLPKELENIVGGYLDMDSYFNLIKYDSKNYNIARYILESKTQLYDSIKLDNPNLFVRFLNNNPVNDEILNTVISNDSVEIFKSLYNNIIISDKMLETIFNIHAFKIALYLSTLEIFSRRKKFFLYIDIFQKGIIKNDFLLTQFFVQTFKLNIRNNLQIYLGLSKNYPQIYNYLSQFK